MQGIHILIYSCYFPSLTHSPPMSLSPSFLHFFLPPPPHSLHHIRPFLHWSTPSFILQYLSVIPYSLLSSPIPSFTPSLPSHLPHSFTNSPIPSFTLFSSPPFLRYLSHSLIHSFTPSFTPSFLHYFSHSLLHSLLISKTFSLPLTRPLPPTPFSPPFFIPSLSPSSSFSHLPTSRRCRPPLAPCHYPAIPGIYGPLPFSLPLPHALSSASLSSSSPFVILTP